MAEGKATGPLGTSASICAAAAASTLRTSSLPGSNAIVFRSGPLHHRGRAICEAAWVHVLGVDHKETLPSYPGCSTPDYLHARATAGWKGRKAAYLGVVGFACWLSTTTCVNIVVTEALYAGV
ncbi:hypothetical protein GCM10020229_65880 [Kitasatospora albolonga]|uniref:hypothetical protein n=1 Tax=Kitasatospora albolonga TaxID=68173 RepID=UPI0031EFF7E6